MDLRYPRLQQMEKAFEKKRKDLNLPVTISLHHPPFFEGKRIKIEFQFETPEEYRRIVESLLNLRDKKELEEIIQSVS
jgi:hypothetical protein